MTYKIDGVDITSLGANPYRGGLQNGIALTGLFDLPKRKGKTEYDWGTSVEPFVEKEDIETEQRMLSLSVCIRGGTDKEYTTKLENYKSACASCRKLGTDFGEFSVCIKEELDIEEFYRQRTAVVTAAFIQKDFSIPELILQPSGTAGYPLLDGYHLNADFGIHTASWKRDKKDLILECSMKDDGLIGIYSKMRQFQALCMKSGFHTMSLSENNTFRLYFKDGITAKTTMDTVVMFNLKGRIAV